MSEARLGHAFSSLSAPLVSMPRNGSTLCLMASQSTMKQPLLGAGVKEWQVLKTTQSGYEGFLHDKYTLLPDTRERMMATSITSTWKCADFSKASSIS